MTSPLVDSVGAILLLAAEALVGLCLGWSAMLVLGAVRGAGVVISDQIGFSLGAAMDPLSPTQEPTLRGFHGAFALYLFLSLDLHHVCLRHAAESFVVLPPGTPLTEGALAFSGRLLLSLGSHLFQAALLIALPVTAVLVLASLIQGVLARVLPEMELLFFGLPLRAVLGMGAVVVCLPFLSSISVGLLSQALDDGRALVEELARW